MEGVHECERLHTGLFSFLEASYRVKSLAGGQEFLAVLNVIKASQT